MRIGPLVRSHRLDHGFHRLEGVVLDFNIPQSLAQARNHPHQILHVTHLLDLLDLIIEIVEIKAVGLYLLLQLAGFFLIVLSLGAFHQRNDIPHAEDTVGHTRRIENVERVHLLAHPDKLDRHLHHRTNRQRGPAPGIAVQLGQDHPFVMQLVVECLGGVDRILAGHRVHYEQGFLRFDLILDIANLAHHVLVHGKTAGSIHNHHIESVFLGMANRVPGNLHRVFFLALGEHRHADLLPQGFQLVDSRRTIDVGRHQQRFLVLLVLQEISQLGRVGRLTGTLQTRHQDHRRVNLQVQFRRLAPHQGSQLVVYYLDHHLAGRNGGQHVLPHGLFLDRIGKLLGNLIVYIRV